MKREGKAVTVNLPQNPAEQSCIGVGRRTHVIVVRCHKPTWIIGLVQKDKEPPRDFPGRLDPFARGPDCLPQCSRRKVRPYVQRQTASRNGVTLYGSPLGAGVNRIPYSGRIPQEAKAAGKAGRYADVGTVVLRCAEPVTLNIL